jgi:hypothetical protein
MGIVHAAGRPVEQIFAVDIEAVHAHEHAAVVGAGEFDQLASLTRLLPVAPASGPLSGRSGYEPAGKTGRIGQK